jgi:hypothetical protein
MTHGNKNYLNYIKGRETFNNTLLGRKEKKSRKDIYVSRTCHLYDIVEEKKEGEKENTSYLRVTL